MSKGRDRRTEELRAQGNTGSRTATGHTEDENCCSDDGLLANDEDQWAAHLDFAEDWERRNRLRRRERAEKARHSWDAYYRRAGRLHPHLMSARVPKVVEMDCPFADEVAQEAALCQEGPENPRAQVEFEDLRAGIMREHGAQIRDAIARRSAGPVEISPAPVAASIGRQFAEAFASGSATLVPAYHGSNSKNYASICARGLLVPGSRGGEDIRVANGSAHGRGVYTANVYSPKLSMGFCSDPIMLVCGVADDSTSVQRQVHIRCGNQATAGKSSVRHCGDALVVSDARRVVPMFTVAAAQFCATGSSYVVGRLAAGSRPLNGRSAAVGPGGLPAATDSQLLGGVRRGGKRKLYHEASRLFAFGPPVPASVDIREIRTKRRFDHRAADRLRKALRWQREAGCSLWAEH